MLFSGWPDTDRPLARQMLPIKAGETAATDLPLSIQIDPIKSGSGKVKCIRAISNQTYMKWPLSRAI